MFSFKIASNIIKFFGISTVQGALTSIYLASDEAIGDVSGLYFDKCRPRKSSVVSYDEKMSRELWSYSENIRKVYEMKIFIVLILVSLISPVVHEFQVLMSFPCKLILTIIKIITLNHHVNYILLKHE